MNSQTTSEGSPAEAYAGSCQHGQFANVDLLQLTNPDRCMIHGPSLFALKYRVLPCTVRENLQISSGSYDDVFAINGLGQFAPFGRTRRTGDKRKMGGMLHATR